MTVEKVIPVAVRNQALLLFLALTLCCPTLSGPYDAIHVGAAAPTLPQDLVDQLASPGRMFIPVGTRYQYIEQVDKDENGNVSTNRLMAVTVGFLIHFTNIHELIV